MHDDTILTGTVLSFTGSPFDDAPDRAAQLHEAVLIRAGRIHALGPLDTLTAQAPEAAITRHEGCLISPGFIDAHAHYPQTAIIASWGKRLIDWLNGYTFPEEMRFGDPAYAALIAERYLDLTLANGTTTTASYCTSHPQSAESFFAAAQARGLRAAAGKTCMDRNAPAALCDTARSAYDDSAALIARWHGVDRLHYVITPRFAPTSTPEQLDALGALWAENPTCLMQTHLSEQTEEIEWVRRLFPQSRDYLDVYETHGLLGERGLYGHAIHLTERETARLSETGAALIHCPTSNTFIGSGLFDMGRRVAEGQRIGLATDTGGGSSFSMLRTMAAAYEIGQLTGTALHPAQLIWLATAGSARALHMQDHIGTIAPGMEADLVVLDLASTPAIAQRHVRAEDIWQALFPTIMMGDDRAVKQVYVAGRALS
ncbi:guanine deaminase [Roseovarius pacificus]|uniref:Guanine deaminase n=1 Tax=Roseovarius pacificus TaxID=337701 RepID=A0A1M7DBJ6_9RHOB|nr:guanine deaminase [Roseovarius pacificus]GGO56717.1 guanine deaminase [Roseovarius pacificus]SHL76901.1 guanine deaminase [Roseovarius pacificus]